jgi:beta-glucosidase-like glycosyl hydrolase
MALGGTMYPQMLGLAATFQPELAQAMTTAIRSQLLAIGARQALAPVLDIARDPRWGRVEETFGEDPTLASHFAIRLKACWQRASILSVTVFHKAGSTAPQSTWDGGKFMTFT